jgi:hypothetical protein
MPTSRALALEDWAYRIAVCLNLGIPPFFYNQGDFVKCGNSGAANACACNSVNLATDLEHALSCRAEQGRLVRQRHDNVQYWFESLARACGVRVTAPSTRYSHDQRCPDSQVWLFDETFLVEFGGRHITSKSYLSAYGEDHERALSVLYTEKKDHYKQITSTHGISVRPFIFSSYGRLHKESSKLIGKIVEHKSKQLHSFTSRKATAHFYKTAIAVSIMRDNASIISAAHGRAANVVL